MSEIRTLVRQATAVVIAGRAVLILGPPGIGKSSLAMALIDRGAQLVGDDGVELQARDGMLFARPHPNTRGLIEVRNLGILELAVCAEAPVALALSLTEMAPRWIEQAEREEIEGVSLPLVALWPGGTILPIKAELALERYGLGV